MLGHGANFSHVFAIKMIENKNILVKKVGYLAASLMLEHDSDMKIMMVATIQKDLNSINVMEITTALNALAKLLNPSLASIFAPSIS